MRKIVFLIILSASLFVIKNLVFSIYNLWQKQDLIVQAKHELEDEKKKNEKLKRELSFAKSERFVEEEARDKLFMVKEGESQVILPNNLLKTKNMPLQTLKEEVPNWKKWLNMFF